MITFGAVESRASRRAMNMGCELLKKLPNTSRDFKRGPSQHLEEKAQNYLESTSSTSDELEIFQSRSPQIKLNEKKFNLLTFCNSIAKTIFSRAKNFFKSCASSLKCWRAAQQFSIERSVTADRDTPAYKLKFLREKTQDEFDQCKFNQTNLLDFKTNEVETSSSESQDNFVTPFFTSPQSSHRKANMLLPPELSVAANATYQPSTQNLGKHWEVLELAQTLFDHVQLRVNHNEPSQQLDQWVVEAEEVLNNVHKAALGSDEQEAQLRLLECLAYLLPEWDISDLNLQKAPVLPTSFNLFSSCNEGKFSFGHVIKIKFSVYIEKNLIEKKEIANYSLALWKEFQEQMSFNLSSEMFIRRREQFINILERIRVSAFDHAEQWAQVKILECLVYQLPVLDFSGLDLRRWPELPEEFATREDAKLHVLGQVEQINLSGNPALIDASIENLSRTIMLPSGILQSIKQLPGLKKIKFN